MKVQSAAGVAVAAQKPAVHFVPFGHVAVLHFVVDGRQRFPPPVAAWHSSPSCAQSSRATTPPWQLTREPSVGSQRPAAVSVPQPSLAPTTKQSEKPPML